MVRPFPYAWLPRWTRDEAALTASVLRRWLPASFPRATRDALPARFSALLGGALTAWPSPPRVLSREELRARYEGDALCAVARHPTLGVIAAIVDAPFALALAARALGGDDEGALRASGARVYGPAQEGALALLCAQAGMLACAPSPPPVVRGVTDRVSEALAAVGSDPVVAWPWRVNVGIFSGEMVLVLAARTLLAGEAPPREVDVEHCAADMDVFADVVIAREPMAAADLGATRAGDVWLLEGALRLDANGALGGDMTLSLGGVDLPVTLDQSRWTITGPAHFARRLSLAGQQGGSEGAGDRAVRTELLDALPTEVEIVLARGAFSVREVASWRVGEVISLPARVGEPVTVRAGGVPVARGELCDVDGSVGVRITERL